MEFTKSNIPKGRNQYRTIYIVDKEWNSILQSHLPYLHKQYEKLDKAKVNYGFVKGKNCALNAMQHIGYDYTLTLDLENFFESVNINHVKGFLKSDILEYCFIDGSPRQGLSTSPLIATIAFLKCDQQIVSILRKSDIKAIYTRYADDLTISFNQREQSGKIEFLISQIVESHGFKINKWKTRLQISSNGRVVVNGIAVDQRGLHPTRKIKKKIRAAMHQMNRASWRGLSEWAKCKLPNNFIFDIDH